MRMWAPACFGTSVGFLQKRSNVPQLSMSSATKQSTYAQETPVRTNGSPNELPEHLLLFDGVCNLCNGLVRFIIRHDRKEFFRFAPLTSDIGKTIVARSHEAASLDTLVYLRKDRLFTRSSAALYVARDLGGIWAVAFIFMLVPSFIRDAVYDLVARKRYGWWGRSAE